MHIPGLGMIKKLQRGVFVAVAQGEQLLQAFCENEPVVKPAYGGQSAFLTCYISY